MEGELKMSGEKEGTDFNVSEGENNDRSVPVNPDQGPDFAERNTRMDEVAQAKALEMKKAGASGERIAAFCGMASQAKKIIGNFYRKIMVEKPEYLAATGVLLGAADLYLSDPGDIHRLTDISWETCELLSEAGSNLAVGASSLVTLFFGTLGMSAKDNERRNKEKKEELTQEILKNLAKEGRIKEQNI
ncbi:MAG: hypothetical protein MUD10_01890 [Candidatus Pacebacteria bacterium]|jgi:hypothetical protein|nr:hypothetical protein [Candidatus Paceibacterota bacterium]